MQQKTFEELLAEVKQMGNKMEWPTSPEEGVSPEVILFVESLLNAELSSQVQQLGKKEVDRRRPM